MIIWWQLHIQRKFSKNSIEDCTKIFDEISINDNEYADLKNYGRTRSKLKKSGYFRGYNNENFVGILSYSKDHLVKEILV